MSANDRVTLVTGGGRGIGAATARLLAEEGVDVVVCYGRNVAGAEETAAAVRAAGRRAWVYALDLRDAAAVAATVEQIGAEVGGLDALILNAGHNIVTPMMETSTEEWDEIIAINLNGPFYLLKAATRPKRSRWCGRSSPPAGGPSPCRPTWPMPPPSRTCSSVSRPSSGR